MIEILEKMMFIRNRLSPLIKKVNPDVKRLVYFFDNSTSEETCHVVFRDNYHKIVNISADSLSAITKDVLRAVE